MLKKEIRILGISAPSRALKRVPVVGVVFRGNQWLDGILTCWLDTRRRDHVSRLAKAIRRSKQYSQIRAVILPGDRLCPGIPVDIADLAKRLNIPVIAMAGRPRTRGRKDSAPRSKASAYDVEVRGRRLVVSAVRVSRDMVEKILNIACAENRRIPEALRVASLVASQIRSPLLNRFIEASQTMINTPAEKPEQSTRRIPTMN